MFKRYLTKESKFAQHRQREPDKEKMCIPVRVRTEENGNICGDDKQGKMMALALSTADSAMGLQANTSRMFFLRKDKGNE